MNLETVWLLFLSPAAFAVAGAVIDVVASRSARRAPEREIAGGARSFTAGS